MWPKQSQVPAFYGEAGSACATAGLVELPYAMKVAWEPSQTIRRFRCHELVAPAFTAIFRDTLAAYGEARIRALGLDLFGGCYNFRPMRGGNAMSMHAYGIAFDIDPARNQLKWTRAKAALAKPEYEPFWKIVEAHGATSLGRAKNFDWMHFQFARV